MTSVAHKLHKMAAIARGGGRSFRTRVVGDVWMKWPVELSRKFWQGEHPDARLMRVLIDRFPERGVFFDVGANLGLYSIALATALGSRLQGVAFEPCPSTVECLSKNLALNGVNTVEISQTALSSGAGTMTLSNYPNGLNNFGVAGNNSDHPTVEVPTITLDEFCEREKTTPDVCKIDVEGHELHVLVGGQAILRRRRPVLLVEVHGDCLPAEDRTSILRHLKDFGYEHIRDVDGRAVTELPDRTLHILCTTTP
jgi:FkbM family methyltransferase